METNAVATVAGAVAEGATSGATSLVSTFVGLGKDLIDRFIPDPQAKLAAQQHLADQAMTIQLAQIDQQNKIVQATSDNVKNDPHSSGSRAFFCYGVTTMILANYGILPLVSAAFHWQVTPFEIPSNILWIFATLMLGFVGVPSVMETLKTVMGMPGDSQVNVLGVKIQNKS